MKIYLLHVYTDCCGTETYYCADLEAVKETVFDIFTDFDINEDTLEEIDEHLRENGVGYFDIEEKELRVAHK